LQPGAGIVHESPIPRGNPTVVVTSATPVFSESESDTRARKFQILPWVVELVIALVGFALMGLGVGANREWLDHHVLPSFLLSRDALVTIETVVRFGLAITGASVVAFVRPALGRVARQAPGLMVMTGLAVVLAIVASEPVLRQIPFRPVEWLSADDEPRRQADAWLGWRLVPSRVGHAKVAGRTVDYVIDPNGYRVAGLDRPVDVARPTLLFIGESAMFGEGLQWEESVPAQVSALTGVQNANLAVHGFGSDQAFLRLQQELPKFQRPRAVVSLFMPSLFGRNLDRERPHLGPGLVWEPAATPWRVRTLARLLVPYRTDATIARGVTVTRDIFRGTSALARARGATPLIVIPQFGVESEPEARLRARIFAGLDLPVLLVPLDPGWRLPWNRHPDARVAHAMAVAIADRLASQSMPSSDR
jgi:hypothetical protein